MRSKLKQLHCELTKKKGVKPHVLCTSPFPVLGGLEHFRSSIIPRIIVDRISFPIFLMLQRWLFRIQIPRRTGHKLRDVRINWLSFFIQLDATRNSNSQETVLWMQSIKKNQEHLNINRGISLRRARQPSPIRNEIPTLPRVSYTEPHAGRTSGAAKPALRASSSSFCLLLSSALSNFPPVDAMANTRVDSAAEKHTQ